MIMEAMHTITITEKEKIQEFFQLDLDALETLKTLKHPTLEIHLHAEMDAPHNIIAVGYQFGEAGQLANQPEEEDDLRGVFEFFSGRDLPACTLVGIDGIEIRAYPDRMSSGYRTYVRKALWKEVQTKETNFEKEGDYLGAWNIPQI